MAKVKCEYCGNYIDETQQTCPSCGAVNAAYQRTAHDTPRTIEELRSWYRARNLPPEEVTRFFIGKDIEEPKAFGIYAKGNRFVVYKNKANGERAIRYEGTDEAYAVNELYLKLKEEILRQKNHNLQRTRSVSSRSFGGARQTGRRGSLVLMIVLAIVLLNVLLIGLAAVLSVRGTSSGTRIGYYRADGELYYYPMSSSYEDGEYRYDWWKYDPSAGDWQLWQTTGGIDEFPEPITEQTEFTYSLPFDDQSFPPEQYDIQRCHAYLDRHPIYPDSDYYVCGGRTYYFLDDPYGGNYGDGLNRTGWYLYDEDDDTWSYYADYDDKEALGEELWYNAESYHLYDYDKANWDTSFYDTEFYQDYQDSRQAYSDYQDEQRTDTEYERDDSWDDDDDYDWDDDWDWDDGGGDWDSDW